MSCEHWREKFTDFIEDSLPADQRQQMEAHLQQCSACAGDWEAFRRTVAALRELPVVAAPEDLPARIRQALPVQQRVFGYRISWQAVGAVAAAACLLVGFWVAFSYQRPGGIMVHREAPRPALSRVENAEAPPQVVPAPAPSPAPSPLPKPGAARAVSPAKSRPRPQPQRRAALPSLKTEPEAAPPAPPVAATDATVPGPPPVEEQVVPLAESAVGEGRELMAPSRGSGAAARATSEADRVAFGYGGNALEKAAAGVGGQAGGVKLMVIPPKERVVGKRLQVKVVIEPEVDVAKVVVRVKPRGTLQVTTPDGVAYRGPLKGGQPTTVSFDIIATDSGTQRLTVELSSELPGVSASVPVSMPNFYSQPLEAEPEPTEGDAVAEHNND